MSFRTVGTAVIAMAVAVSVPLSAATAAVRPGSAVPTAASASSVAPTNAAAGTSALTPWPAYAVIALTMAMSVWIAAKDHKGGIYGISRG